MVAPQGKKVSVGHGKERIPALWIERDAPMPAPRHPRILGCKTIGAQEAGIDCRPGSGFGAKIAIAHQAKSLRLQVHGRAAKRLRTGSRLGQG